MKRKEAQQYVQEHLKEYLEAQGINPNKQFSCLNPSHNDKKPSMGVVNKRDIPRCHCLSCGATYDTFDVIGIVNGVSDFKEKEKIAYQFFNISIDETYKRPLSQEEQQIARYKQIMKEAVEVTRTSLTSNDEFARRSREYLANRQISEKTINDFKIGVEYDNKIPTRLINELYYKKQELLDVGLMRKTSVGDRDTFYNRVLIPICDRFGNPLGFGGRTIEENSRYKYLNTSDTKIFQKGDILFNYHQAKNEARNGELVLVEGYFDVISAWEMGMKNVVASMGVGLQEQQIKLMKELNCEVIVSLDNPLIDEAGKNAMIRIVPQLIKEGLTVSVYDTALLGDKVKDFGDFLTKDIPIDKIKETKIPGLHYLLKYQYFYNRKIDVDTIAIVYNQLHSEKLLNNTRDEMQYKEYIINNSSFTKEDVDNVIHPKEVNKIPETKQEQKEMSNSYSHQVAEVYFYTHLLEGISQYADNSKDEILAQMLTDGKINKEFLFSGIDKGKGFINEGKTFKIKEFIETYVLKSKEYKMAEQKQTEARKKEQLKQMPDILDNVYGFDKSGKEVKIYLTDKQKEIVLKQYLASFEEKTKEFVKDPANAIQYTKLFIADNQEEYEKLWMGLNTVNMQKWICDYFSLGYMAAVPYNTCFSTCGYVDLKKLYEDYGDKYVVKDGDKYRYKTLLVFNNKENLLELTYESYIKPPELLKKNPMPNKEVDINKDKKTKPQRQQKVQQEQKATSYSNNKGTANKPTNVLAIPLKEGQYLTTNYGIYVINPATNREAVYIDNTSYKENDNMIEIDMSRKNPMSLYSLSQEGDLSVQSRTFLNRLEKEEFKDNYQTMYITKSILNNDEELKEMIS